jgi:tetratricopeptide (TPR) repeat protein
MWVGPILFNALQNEKKPDTKKMTLVWQAYETIGDRAQARNEPALALEAYQRALDVLRFHAEFEPNTALVLNSRRDMSGKLAILKGHYGESADFRGSLRDETGQSELRDRDRLVQSSNRLDELIAAAERDWQENPGVASKFMDLIDLLCREEDERREKQAVELLVNEYQRTNDYRFKQRADDLRLQQASRRCRKLRQTGDKEGLKAALSKQLAMELQVYDERVTNQPADNRLKYEYATRLFKARKYDDAIPLFQTARSDPKSRLQADLYLGRCFLAKGYHEQAVSTLSKAWKSLDAVENDFGKDVLYWLARAQEESGVVDEAKENYGRLLEMDYNFRDVRDRMDALRQSSKKQP